MLGHLDAELISMLETTVPPLDLVHVSAFRMALQTYEKQVGWQVHLISPLVLVCAGV